MIESTGGEGVVGASKVVEIFGRWPGFHGAEVVRIELTRNSRQLRLELVTERVQPDPSPNRELFAIDWLFDEVTNVQLEGWNEQNVLWSLLIARAEDGFRVDLEPSYGVAGSFTCQAASIEAVRAVPEA